MCFECIVAPNKLFTRTTLFYIINNKKVIFYHNSVNKSNPFHQNEFVYKNGNEEKTEHQASISKIFNT